MDLHCRLAHHAQARDQRGLADPCAHDPPPPPLLPGDQRHSLLLKSTLSAFAKEAEHTRVIVHADQVQQGGRAGKSHAGSRDGPDLPKKHQSLIRPVTTIPFHRENSLGDMGRLVVPSTPWLKPCIAYIINAMYAARTRMAPAADHAMRHNHKQVQVQPSGFPDALPANDCRKGHKKHVRLRPGTRETGGKEPAP